MRFFALWSGSPLAIGCHFQICKIYFRFLTRMWKYDVTRSKTDRILRYQQFCVHYRVDIRLFADIAFPWRKEVILTDYHNNWRVFLQDGGRKPEVINLCQYSSQNVVRKNNNTTLSGFAETAEHRSTSGVNSVCMNLHISAHKPEVVISSLDL